LVQDQQVELLDAELPDGLFERVQGLIKPVVGDPDLGLDEDLVAGEPTATDGLADLALVAISRSCVDVSVAGGSAASTADRVSSGGVWNTPRPSAGSSTPLFSVSVETSGMIFLVSLVVAGLFRWCAGLALVEVDLPGVT